MICVNCNAENHADAKFCTSCGQPFNQGNVQTGDLGVNQGNVGTGQPVQPAEPNPTVEKAKVIGQSFWKYFLAGLKAPYRMSLTVGSQQADLINGLITLILFALFVPFTGYLATNHYANSFLGSFSSTVKPPFFESVIKPFIFMVIFIAILVAILFAVSRLMKSEIDFMAVFTRFMTFMIIPAGLVTLAFVVSLVNAYVFGGFLIFLAFSIMFLSGVASIFSIKTTTTHPGGIDVIYVIIIHYIILFIVLIIFGDAMIGQLTNELDSLFSFF